MELHRVWPGADLVLSWHWVWPILYRALPETTQQRDMLDRINGGEFQLFRVGHSGVLATSVGAVKDLPGSRCLWVVYAAGGLPGGPKRRLAAMLDLLRQVETMARNDGCTEVRVEAGRWGRVLRGYDRIAPGIYRKALD